MSGKHGQTHTEAKSRAESRLRELTTVSGDRGRLLAQSYVDGTSAVSLPDNQREVDDTRLAVASLSDQVVAATSSLKEWQDRVQLAEVALLREFQRSAAAHFTEVAATMQTAFSIAEAGHRLLEGEHRQASVRPSAWHRFAIPAPDADPRRYTSDDGCAWSARLAGESGECARAVEALQALVAE